MKSAWGLIVRSCTQAGDLTHHPLTANGPLAGRAAYTFSDKPNFHQKTSIPMRSKHLIPNIFILMDGSSLGFPQMVVGCVRAASG